jgi:exodeoxyribonuclease-5
MISWTHDPAKRVLTVGGRAGSGKTTIIKKLLNAMIQDEVAITAFTGKAASVLKRKGLSQAQTLHSLMYHCEGRDATGRLIWKRVKTLGVRIVIVDEASMVSLDLHNDLASFGVKVLYIGDHWQLEPIGNNPNLMASPDLILEKIHRQAEGSPIIRFADQVHHGLKIFPHRKVPGLEVTGARRFWEVLDKVEVALVGFNNTRHDANRMMRELRGFYDKLPSPGEKLICLRNDREFGVYNGLVVTVTNRGTVYRDTVFLDVEDDLGYRWTNLPAYIPQFGVNSLSETAPRDVVLFDWGNALTVHKSQGSQYRSGAILEEIGKTWSPERWRYTAVTRFSDEVIYCR